MGLYTSLSRGDADTTTGASRQEPGQVEVWERTTVVEPALSVWEGEPAPISNSSQAGLRWFFVAR